MNKSDQIDLAVWLKNQTAEITVGVAVNAIVSACCEISELVRNAPLSGLDGTSDQTNVQGETQKQLDIISNDLMVDQLGQCPEIAALLSEEVPEVIVNNDACTGADLVVCFDPLDGSSNIETNSTIGTIFSVLKLAQPQPPVAENDILQAAGNQVAAGFVLYGPATLLVMTTGKTVAIFALSQNGETFVLLQDHIVIPQETSEFAINIAYSRFWDSSVSTYIDQCLEGHSGPRGKDFNMRWTGSMVADVFRLFKRGGIFLYPALNRPGGSEGKLRFLYEANPMAFLVGVAGGKAIMGTSDIRDFIPTGLHQRVPVILGSRREVETLSELYRANQT